MHSTLRDATTPYTRPLATINQIRMKNTVFKILIVFTLLLPIYNYSQNIVTTDYSTNKPFTMPDNLIVKPGKSNHQLIMNINYPKEPNANTKDKIKISKDGTQLNKIDIKSKQNLSNGQIQITTHYSGKDNGKKALIKNIYIIGNSDFIIRKEVKFENSDDWLMRNEYKYSR